MIYALISVFVFLVLAAMGGKTDAKSVTAALLAIAFAILILAERIA